MYTLEWVLSRPEEFRYQLLDRMRQDCNYYLGNGQVYGNHLWAGNDNEEEHITIMKAIWHSLPDKPVWLTLAQIVDTGEKMLMMKHLWGICSSGLADPSYQICSDHHDIKVKFFDIILFAVEDGFLMPAYK
jgi:hypothetical protein